MKTVSYYFTTVCTYNQICRNQNDHPCHYCSRDCATNAAEVECFDQMPAPSFEVECFDQMPAPSFYNFPSVNFSGRLR